MTLQAHAAVDPPRPPRGRAHAVLIAPAVALAWLCAVTLWILYRIHLIAFFSGSRLLALMPGAFGIRARRYWYQRTLAACGADLTVDWLTALKTPEARVGSGVFIGSMCWVAEVDIRDNVMVGSRCALQGGSRTHGTGRLDIPMNRQPGTLVTVTIGPDAWIGTGATVLADVAPGTVVAAGAVVTAPLPPYSVIGGVPARVLRARPGATRGAPDA